VTAPFKHLSLRCHQCGSTVLSELALNQYKCNHCGAITVIKDDVSDRLDKVLDQVKDAAADRLAQQEAVRQKTAFKIAGLAIAAFAGIMVLSFALPALFGKKALSVVASSSRPSIDASKIIFSDPKQVVLRQGSSLEPAMLVTVRNDTGHALDASSVSGKLFNGDQEAGNVRADFRRDVLLPGESETLMFELPAGKSFTRAQWAMSYPRVADFKAESGVMPLKAHRFIRQSDKLVLAVSLQHTLTAVVTQVRIAATALDAAGQVIALGRGYVEPSDIPKDREALSLIELKSVGDLAQAAAVELVVSYSVRDAKGGYTRVAANGRVQRLEGKPEVLAGDFDLHASELLMSDAVRFDLTQLQLTPMKAARDETQDLIYLSEIVNNSNVIALNPEVALRTYNGAQLVDERSVNLPDLYPSERFPIALDKGREPQLTAIKAEFKPIRKAEPPGSRPSLQVKLGKTQAGVGSVLVNFSQRYRYKYVDVEGTVHNTSTQVVGKPRLWIMLRDAKGGLSGFAAVDQLTAIAPGDSIPFKASVKQMGADFARVETFYSVR
jgi:DNA-directed RNA polymerase subunit RPC12/RpoP